MAGIISFIFGAIELVLALRFVFLLLGANPDAQFVTWIYNLSIPFVAPFAGILGRPTTSTDLVQAAPSVGTVVPSIFDPSTLVALVIYAAIGGVLLALFRRNG
jgi:YggT family protein